MLQKAVTAKRQQLQGIINWERKEQKTGAKVMCNLKEKRAVCLALEDQLLLTLMFPALV